MVPLAWAARNPGCSPKMISNCCSKSWLSDISFLSDGSGIVFSSYPISLASVECKAKPPTCWSQGDGFQAGCSPKENPLFPAQSGKRRVLQWVKDLVFLRGFFRE